jgi:DNA helicase-2/ATP-dependent DNA helicase PcrA
MDAASYAEELDQAFRTCAAAHDLDTPFVAAFTLEGPDKVHEYRLGARSIPADRVLDWRHALAGAYYLRPGEDFELDERGFRKLDGTLVRKAALEVAARAVRAVLVTTPGGQQRLLAGPEGFAASGGRAPRASERILGDLRAWLTPEQYRLISQGRSQPLILRGRAGSGKTSVALHRVAWLAQADETRSTPPIDPSRVLIVMFNKALSTYVRGLLAPLGLERARLDTFHAWALDAARRAYGGKLEISTAALPGDEEARRVKAHVGLLAAIDAFVARQLASSDAYLAEKLTPYREVGAAWLAAWRASEGPLGRRLAGLRNEALRARDAASGLEQKRLVEVHLIFKAACDRVALYKEDLTKILTDVPLLAAHLPDVPQATLEAAAANRRALADRDRSERRVGPYVRFADLALLVRLLQRKQGGLFDARREEVVPAYDHLVLDEAQDLGAIEIAVLLAAVRSRTGVTIVGDLNQKIVPSAAFVGWEALAAELGVAGARVQSLEVAHRATQPIMALADALLGEPPSGGREGLRPNLVRAASAEAIPDAVFEALFEALHDGPEQHLAVVLRHVADVEPLADQLKQRFGALVDVRTGHNQEFRFDRGITVTNYRQVKGLEFDAVVVVEPDAEAYPDSLQGRRDLYTIATRARDRLSFVASRPLSPLLEHALAEGLLSGPPEDDVPPAELGDLDEPL